MEKQFPKTKIGNVELSRMIMGTNFLLGWSHTSDSMNAAIKEKYATPEAFLPVLEAYLKHGVNAIMAPFPANPALPKAVKMTEDKLGKEIVMIDTMFLDLTDSDEGRANAEQTIRESAARGTKIFTIHTFCVRNLLNLLEERLVRVEDYTKMIRDAGMVPAIGAHMPEIVEVVDKRGYDFESYIQLWNCVGFLMQQEIEKCGKTIHNAKKPVMTIKPMAAGRVSPYVGLSWAWNTIRDCDLVAVGAANAEEVEEDIEISFAALEHRFPNLEFNL